MFSEGSRQKLGEPGNADDRSRELVRLLSDRSTLNEQRRGDRASLHIVQLRRENPDWSSTSSMRLERQRSEFPRRSIV